MTGTKGAWSYLERIEPSGVPAFHLLYKLLLLVAWSLSICAVCVCSLRHSLCSNIDTPASGLTFSASKLILLYSAVLQGSLLWRSGLPGLKFVICCMILWVLSFSTMLISFSFFATKWQVACAWLSCILQVRIAMVGKYTGLSDSYLSVLKVNALFLENFVYPSAAFLRKKNMRRKRRVVVWMYCSFSVYFCRLSFTLSIWLLIQN